VLLCAADVNSLTSPETELPFDYYTMPFCKPPEGVKKSLSSINPGTILMGARIENSPYNFSMMVCCPCRLSFALGPGVRVC
jgi:transmembrane 9 superfamily member 2/4